MPPQTPREKRQVEVILTTECSLGICHGYRFERYFKTDFYVQNLRKFLRSPYTFDLPKNLDLPENPTDAQIDEHRREVARRTTSYQLFRPNNQLQFFIFLSGVLGDKLVNLSPEIKAQIQDQIAIIRLKAVENGRTLRTVEQMDAIKNALKEIIRILVTFRNEIFQEIAA